MPEASVYKHGLLMLWKDNIWPAREVFPVNPESVAHPVQHRPNDELGLGILAADPAHEAGPGLQ